MRCAVVLLPRVVRLVDCRGEGAVGGLEPARVIGVAHALRVEVYAYLALGRSRKQGDVLHVVPELAEAGGVRLPFVDLPCILQGLRQLQFLGRRSSIGVAHALRVEVYAYLALGRSGKERDVLHAVPELAEAGSVRLPFVDLPCILQGLR